MLYCVHIIDSANAVEPRLKLTDAHRSYTLETGVNVVASGPLLADDRKTMIGSLIVVNLPGRAEVEKFINEDPFMTGGVWERVDINPFYWRVGRPEGLEQEIAQPA